MALKYTTVVDFVKYIGFYRRVPSTETGDTSNEVVGIGNTVNSTFYLAKLGVLSDTVVLTTSGNNDLTVDTHYTFEALTSKVTLTATGITVLDKDNLLAAYGYIQEGVNLSEGDVEDFLERSESEVDESVGTGFADQSTSSPDYVEVSNELHFGHGFDTDRYKTSYYPVVKLQTTTDGAFITGATAVTLADGSGFPNSGTIQISSNKVSYTAKNSNVLTVATSTPSLEDGSVVRGEIVEVSLTASGATPSWDVLTADTDYAFDYDTGLLQLLDNYYNGNLSGISRPPNGVMDRVRINYFSAWHPVSRSCFIPKDVVKLIYKMAALELADSAVLKSNASNLENFSPTVLARIRTDVERTLSKYKSYGIDSV